MVKLLNRYKNKSIFEINNTLYGKVIGALLNTLIIIYVFSISFLLLRSYVDILKIIILRLTNPIFLTVIIFLPYAYLTYYGLKVLCRFCNISYLVIVVLLLYLLLIRKNVDLNYIMPVGEAGFKNIIHGVPISASFFLGIELVAIIYPEVKDKHNLMKNTIYALIFTTVFNTLIIVFVLRKYWTKSQRDKLLIEIKIHHQLKLRRSDL